MTREPNLYDLDVQGLRRHHRHNPLFNVLTLEFDDAFKERQVSDEYIIDHYYVDERDDKDVTNSEIIDAFPGMKGVKRADDLAKGISGAGQIFLLIGKKGMGKTILLKYYGKRVLKTIENSNSKRLLIHLDLRNLKSDTKFLSELPESLIESIYYYIKGNNGMREISKYLSNPEYIKELDDSYKHYSNNDVLITRVLDNKTEAIHYLFKYLTSQGYELIMVIDNIDDFGKSYVQSIIDRCQYMKDQYNMKSIVAVRDYWTPNKLGIDDSQICAKYLCPPNIKKVIKERLNNIDTSSVTGKLKIIYDGKPILLTSKDIIDTFDIIVDDLMGAPDNLYDQLYKLTNYDLRVFLENLYYFFHSPYLYSRPNFVKALHDKIKRIDKIFSMGQRRSTRFFDFIECFMTPHSLCYDIDDSNIFNLFFHFWDYGGVFDYKNTLIFVRILQIAPDKGDPFKKEYIVEQLEAIGYDDKKAIKNAISILLNEALLESPEGLDYEDVIGLKISVKGQIYLKKLIKEFSYMVFICDAVPMPSAYKVDIHKKFGNQVIPLERGDLIVKHNSVKMFIEFLKSEERKEEEICPNTNVLHRIKGSLLNDVEKAIETAIRKMLYYGRTRVKKISDVTEM